MIFKRKTAVSESVLDILESNSKPISFLQLKTALLKQGLTPNKSTIYRILEKLKEKSVISELYFKNGSRFFELESRHHHHFYCTNCDDVYCLDQCTFESPNHSLNDLAPNPNFNIQLHDFNLYGICDSCSAHQTSKAVTLQQGAS